MSGERYLVTDDTKSGDAARRRFETIDMMLSMHSTLAQENERRALWLDLTVLCASLTLATTALMDPAVLTSRGISTEGARVFLAGSSLVVFALSIVGLRVDWKERAGRHQRAASILAELKARWRAVANAQTDADHAAVEQLDRHATFAMTLLPPIPESDFQRLKAKHKKKVALSKLIDTYPGAWLPLLRVKVFLRESLAATRDKPPSGTA